MSLLLSLVVAVPFACLALLSLLSFVGVMVLGGMILFLGTATASWRRGWSHRRSSETRLFRRGW